VLWNVKMFISFLRIVVVYFGQNACSAFCVEPLGPLYPAPAPPFG
jgi:hypothetical protein